MPRASRLALASFVLSAIALTSGAGAQLEGVEIPRNALAFHLSPAGDAETAGFLLPDLPPDGGQVLLVVEVPWAADNAGEADVSWEALDRRLDAIRRAGSYLIVLRPGSDPSLSAEPGGSEDTFETRHAAWARFVRDLARRYTDDVAWFLLDPTIPAALGADDARRLAFVVKSFAVTVRAEAPSAGVAVSLREEDAADTARGLFADGDLAPYVDAAALDTAGRPLDPSRVNELGDALLEAHPGASLWVVGADPGRPDLDGGAALFRSFVQGLDAGASLVAFAPGLRTPPQAALHSPVVPRLRALFVADLGPFAATGAPVRFEREDGGEAEVFWTRLFDPQTFRVLLIYAARDPDAGESRIRLIFDGRLARRPRLEDPVADRGRSRGFEPVEGAPPGTVSITLPLSGVPRILTYQEGVATPGLDLSPEELEVRRTRGLTAEEIIARHQRYQTWQDDRLRHYRGRGRIDFHFRFGSLTGTLDLQVRGDFFWERGTGAEWAFQEIYFNGVKSTWDRVPEIPFISRSEVVSVPLNIELDKRYAYERVEDELVDGRDCYQLRFRPLDVELALYRGRAWIDKATYAMVRVASAHTQVTPPTVSVEERILFRPFEAPDGLTYWTMARVDSEEIRTVNARNLVVEREVLFEEILINDPAFRGERDQAYASPRQMIRETPSGLKWLERTDEGGRRPVEGDKDALFAVAGVLRDESLDGDAIPLAGINYTNIDLFERGWLLNVFFAGAFANVNLSDPSIAGTKLDLGITAGLFGFEGTDKVFVNAEEVERQRVGTRPQSLTVNLGYPLGGIVKLRGSYSAEWINYLRTEETERFTPPKDTLVQTGLLEIAVDWRGWGLRARGSRSRRSDWEPWGPDGNLVGEQELEDARDFEQWSGQISKAFFLPFFQKIEFSGDWYGGRDLDRFSQYRLGFLAGTRVRGFGGSGIRFEQGAVLKGQYSFSIAEAVRFDFNVDHAIVKDRQLSTDRTEHTGVGIAANFLGPWRTAFRLDAGYAVRSDLREAEGDWELLLAILKVF